MQIDGTLKFFTRTHNLYWAVVSKILILFHKKGILRKILHCAVPPC